MPVTQQLYALYLLDRQIHGLTSRVDSTKARVQQQAGRLAQYQRQYHEMVDQLKHARAKASELEKEALDVGLRIDHQREVMNTVTNNKQYSALLIEVNTFREEKNKIEEIALEQLGQIEVMEGELGTLVERVQSQTKLVNLAEAEVAESEAEIKQQLEELQGQRASAAAGLSPTARAMFDQVNHTHDGEGMAPVVEMSRRNREYSCGGCYLTIPVERVSGLMSSADQVVVCPNCNRILYLEQDLRTALTR